MSEAKTYIEKVKAGLSAAGLTTDTLTTQDLAPVDQFHVGGLQVVQDLIGSADFRETDHVLDIGSGTGGPARILAQTTGCRVTGIDLSEVSVTAGNIMTDWTGQSDHVDLIEGAATELPFEDGTFDAAWSIHVGMFVADKSRFYSQAHRVLKPGGRISIFDPCSAGSGDHAYPVPWAKSAADNHIITPDALQEELEQAGFIDITRVDRTREVREWFAARQAAAKQSPTSGPPPLGLHLLVGPDFGVMTGNAAQGVMSGAISFFEFHGVKSG